MWHDALIDPPPIGENWYFLSENVEVCLDDGSTIEGFYDHFTKEWSAIDDNCNWIMPANVTAWRYY